MPCENKNEKKGTGEAIKIMPVDKIDLLETFFDNSNWLLAENKDSSYYYFSRLNSADIDVYHFVLRNGDSSNTRQTKIRIDAANRVTWDFFNTPLFLESASKSLLIWKGGLAKDSSNVTFKKTAAGSIEIERNNEVSHFKKTLPVSLFLVRSRYDYLHGTKLAFDMVTAGRKKVALHPVK